MRAGVRAGLYDQSKVAALFDGFNRRLGVPRGPGGWWLMTEVEIGYMTVAVGGVGDVLRAEPFDAVELDVGKLFGKETA